VLAARQQVVPGTKVLTVLTDPNHPDLMLVDVRTGPTHGIFAIAAAFNVLHFSKRYAKLVPPQNVKHPKEPDIWHIDVCLCSSLLKAPLFPVTSLWCDLKLSRFSLDKLFTRSRH
jgi:hypothetical protein